ncbi:hypothetical protein STW0522ENT66_37000 [Enterobacter roggenkampii]|nr:hypothetical protein STW0522ENT66_37000 [Enterobacter roggenkampii]GCG68629.1 hypothetical protein BvCmsH35A_00326 [Escherichia coli]
MGYGGLGDHEMAWLFHVIEAELLTTQILKRRSHAERSDTEASLLNTNRMTNRHSRKL